MRKNIKWLVIASGVIALIIMLTKFDVQSDKPDIRSDKPDVQRDKQIEKPDFSSFSDVNEKKQAFFEFLRPGIQRENQRISKERARLFTIDKALREDNLSSKDLEFAKQLGQLYSSDLPEEGVSEAWLNEMLVKVNLLPEALVLTQAANESAWGTSRFAREANNFFGQWCYKVGCGLVPLQRAENATHEVAKFDSAFESVNGYFMNLNRHRAYKKLRAIRADIDIQGKDLLSPETANALTNGLLSYSERGQDYVDDLQTMIRINNKFWITKSND